MRTRINILLSLNQDSVFGKDPVRTYYPVPYIFVNRSVMLRNCGRTDGHRVHRNSCAV